jgi:sucrose-6F-phosphate phosphohydrolase
LKHHRQFFTLVGTFFPKAIILNDKILICTDLDRTLLPNGEAPESPLARELFRKIAQHPEVRLAYVTGRHRELVVEAIADFQLPTPNYVLADVGSSIYEVNGEWRQWQAWQDEIAPCWHGFKHEQLAELFDDVRELRLQEAAKQNRFKLSYYVPLEADTKALLAEMERRLEMNSIRASLIWSIDDLEHVGLLDILPQNATKLHAIEFLMQNQGYQHANTLFAGDSGNDLPVLASGVNSVLVANAREDVRQQAVELAAEQGNSDCLYIAQGGLKGMNGNYSAGIIEGLLHFIPSSQAWLA